MGSNLQHPDRKPGQTSSTQDDTHSNAYERMLQRTRDLLESATQELKPSFGKALDEAREQASRLGELTREEAETVAEYLRRDIHDAAEYLADQGGDLRDWLRFDIQLVEDRILDAFALAADTTKLELQRLAERAREIGEWHTGEITGPGTLVCKACEEELHFHKTGRIPPCPKCKATRYRRGEHTE